MVPLAQRSLLRACVDMCVCEYTCVCTLIVPVCIHAVCVCIYVWSSSPFC